MQRIAVVNVLIGFLALFFSACAGSFIAHDTAQAFLADKSLLTSWQTIVLKSSHGHTNLFGLTHISLGLTLSWSNLSIRVKNWQTVGLSLGTFAMSALMIARSFVGPPKDTDLLGISLGICLSAALAALGLHCIGLYMKLCRVK